MELQFGPSKNRTPQLQSAEPQSGKEVTKEDLLELCADIAFFDISDAYTKIKVDVYKRFTEEIVDTVQQVAAKPLEEMSPRTRRAIQSIKITQLARGRQKIDIRFIKRTEVLKPLMQLLKLDNEESDVDETELEKLMRIVNRRTNGKPHANGVHK